MVLPTCENWLDSDSKPKWSLNQYSQVIKELSFELGLSLDRVIKKLADVYDSFKTRDF